MFLKHFCHKICIYCSSCLKLTNINLAHYSIQVSKSDNNTLRQILAEGKNVYGLMLKWHLWLDVYLMLNWMVSNLYFFIFDPVRSLNITLTSHEAYCLSVRNHSGHYLYTRGWGDMRWRASPTGIRTQYHPVNGGTMLPTELTRLAV